MERIDAAFALYPESVQNTFPDLPHEVRDFLSIYSDSTATPEISDDNAIKYSSSLINILKIIAKRIKTKTISTQKLFRDTITPSHDMGEYQQGKSLIWTAKHGENNDHKYHILFGNSPDLTLLLQRVPEGTDTKAEVHSQGIEIYLPLVDGVEFTINDNVYKPRALSEILIIYPGDVHHHIKPEVERKGKYKPPARVLILGGFGFKLGEKIPEDQITSYIAQSKFVDLPRAIKI